MKSAWILGFIPIIVLAAACSEYFKSNENHTNPFRSHWSGDYMITQDDYWLHNRHVKGFSIKGMFDSYEVKGYLSGFSYTIADGFSSKEEAHKWLDGFLEDRK